MGAPRLPISCSRTACSGSTTIASMGCASMRWPRCSISITAGPRATGFPTAMAAARTSRRSASCAASTPRSSPAFRKPPPPPQRGAGHGKRSILGRMPGDAWQRFANLRAYYGFMFGHPGKKLLFMGAEFGQENEWRHDHSLDWHLLKHARHAGVQALVRDLNRLYRTIPALHELDCEDAGFEWLVMHDAERSVFAWLRKGRQTHERCLVVVNFTP